MGGGREGRRISSRGEGQLWTLINLIPYGTPWMIQELPDIRDFVGWREGEKT